MPLQQRNILVVDDDRDIREIITYVLEGEGYAVAALDSGRLVLDTVQATLPDMVILDIQLGDLDGRDICRELKAGLATKDIPVMMISANNSWTSLYEKCCHADDFLAKPFDIDELLTQVRRYAA